MVRTVVKAIKTGSGLDFANTRIPLKPRYFGHFQLRSFDIKAIVSTWHECSGMMLLYMETSRSMVVVHGNRSVEGVMIVAFRELEHFLIIALIVLTSITWFKLMESAVYAWALYSGKVLFSYRRYPFHSAPDSKHSHT